MDVIFKTNFNQYKVYEIFLNKIKGKFRLILILKAKCITVLIPSCYIKASGNTD
jgi:hypothetical protein